MFLPGYIVVLSNTAVGPVAVTERSVGARGCSRIERRDRGRASAVLAGNIGGTQVVGITSVTVGGDTVQGASGEKGGGSRELSIGARQSWEIWAVEGVEAEGRADWPLVGAERDSLDWSGREESAMVAAGIKGDCN